MFRFRLRTLLAMLLVAALAVWLGQLWHRRNWAILSELQPGSSDSVLFEYTVSTEKLDDEYTATIHLRRRPCGGDMFGNVTKRHRSVHPNVAVRTTNDLYHVITLASPSQRDLDRAAMWWQQEDQVQPGQIVINGVIVDRKGFPVRDCFLDLIGPDPLIGKHCSRDDGTFTMPMPARTGNYYLRVRNMQGEVEARTAVFGVDLRTKERTVRIQVPFEAPPQGGPGGGFFNGQQRTCAHVSPDQWSG